MKNVNFRVCARLASRRVRRLRSFEDIFLEKLTSFPTSHRSSSLAQYRVVEVRTLVIFAANNQQAHTPHTLLVGELHLRLVKREHAAHLRFNPNDHLTEFKIHVEVGIPNREAVSDRRTRHPFEEVSHVVLSCRVRSQRIQRVVQRRLDAVLCDESIEPSRSECVQRCN